MANYAYWNMKFFGERSIVDDIVDRISAGFADEWTSDGFDTAIFPVTINLGARTEYDFWENWVHAHGSSKRLARGEFVGHELSETPCEDHDPLSVLHHEAQQLDEAELRRLQRLPIVPKPLPCERSMSSASSGEW
jgi:hypothetical protein